MSVGEVRGMSEQPDRFNRFARWWRTDGAHVTVLSLAAGWVVNATMAGPDQFDFVAFVLGALALHGLAALTMPLIERRRLRALHRDDYRIR